MKLLKNLLIFTFILCNIIVVSAQNDAALDVEATDQGVLLPRVALSGTSDTITIVSPTVSLLVYNTATAADVLPGFYFWDGTSWTPMAGAQSSGHYVGELWGGGIVFFVYDNGQHGLIASLDDLGDSTGVYWALDSAEVDVPNCESQTNGTSNTASIIAAGGYAYEAAGLCDSFSAGGFTDWYLPAHRELYLLGLNDILIDQILDNDGDPNTNGFSQEDLVSPRGAYWSSTETGYPREIFIYGFADSFPWKHKDQLANVRAIRAF